MTPQEQLRVLLAMTLCGAALGCAYDVIWLLKRLVLRGSLAQAADLFFGVLCAAGIIAAALALRAEAFRLYTLLGAGMGMAIYRLTAGTLLRCAVKAGAGKIKKRTESAAASE